MKHLERLDLLENIGSRLQEEYSTTQINSLLRSLGITEELVEVASSKRVYAREKLAALEDERLLALAQELGLSVPEDLTKDQDAVMPESNRTVFVIHGRNQRMRSELFSFLRAAGLDPLEWSEAVKLTGKGAPYIGEVLDHAFEEAAAVVVLLTPDDVVRLSEPLVVQSDGPQEREARMQPRPNVIFEAGMAFGRYPERTIIVSVGNPKRFSDVAGRHEIRLSNDPERRLDLLERLRTAGCAVRSTERRDWLKVGDFRLQVNEERPSVKVSGPSELSNSEEQIIDLLTERDKLNAQEVGYQLDVSPVAAEHHLETLEEQDYLRAQYTVGQPTKYMLDKKGRAYAVENGLV